MASLPADGHGHLWVAPLGTAEPACVVRRGAFAPGWPAGWDYVGATWAANFSQDIGSPPYVTVAFVDSRHLDRIPWTPVRPLGVFWLSRGVEQSVGLMVGWESHDAEHRFVVYQARVRWRQPSGPFHVLFGVGADSCGRTFEAFTVGRLTPGVPG